MLVPFKQLKS